MDKRVFSKPDDEGHTTSQASEVTSAVESKEAISPIYTGLFVDNVSELVALVPPQHSKVFAHHSTIAFKPGSLTGIEVGKKHTLKILGRVFDEKGDALLVENPKAKGENPHITLSCAEGTSPVYSNELLKRAIAEGSVIYFNPPLEIEVTEGYFDGKGDVVGTQ